MYKIKLAVKLLIFVFYFFISNTSFSDSSCCPVREEFNPNGTVTFYFTGCGSNLEDCQLIVWICSEYEEDTPYYTVTGASSPHTPEIIFEPGTYCWKMINLKTGRISHTKEFTVQ